MKIERIKSKIKGRKIVSTLFSKLISKCFDTAKENKNKDQRNNILILKKPIDIFATVIIL